jgi:hypothetical protein
MPRRHCGGRAGRPFHLDISLTPKLWALTVSHDHVAKSIDMSDVDRHLFGNYAAGLKPYVQRVRAYGELSTGKTSAGSRRSGPLRFVA